MQIANANVYFRCLLACSHIRLGAEHHNSTRIYSRIALKLDAVYEEVRRFQVFWQMRTPHV